MSPRLELVSQLYNVTEQLALKALKEAKPETLNIRPNDKANSLAWVFGHIVASRLGIAKTLGIDESRDWDKLYDFGAEVKEPEAYPSIDELKETFADINAKLKARFEEMTDDDLKGEPAFKIPGIEESPAGIVAFMSLHESYHVGQLGYIQRLHGGEKLVG